MEGCTGSQGVFWHAEEAAIPFATGRRTWKMRTLACSDRRALAFMMEARYVLRMDTHQPSLF